MVEIPAAALLAREFAAEVDFFSIGTNDLTQYTLAAERGNARLAALADPLQPAVLRLIRDVVEPAATGQVGRHLRRAGGDPLAIPLLVGLEVDELSMNPVAIRVPNRPSAAGLWRCAVAGGRGDAGGRCGRGAGAAGSDASRLSASHEVTDHLHRSRAQGAVKEV